MAGQAREPSPAAAPEDRPAVDPADLTRVVALDGPAGSGKSTVARRVARALDWRFVDTGAGYRAATLAALRAGVDLADAAAVVTVVRGSRIRLGTSEQEPVVTLDGEDVSQLIRTPEVTGAVSALSAHPEVRHELIRLQRAAMGMGGAVVEGRDIATVVAPHAAVKVYLDARPDVRARRRAAQLGALGTGAEGPGEEGGRTSEPRALDDSQAALLSRDARDNETTPLHVSDGAVHLDTSDLSLEQVVDAVVGMARQAGLLGPEPVPAALGSQVASKVGPQDVPARRWVRATGRRKGWLITASRPFGWLLFHVLFRLRVVGAQHVPRTGPVLIAGNHTGFLDGPLAYALTPRPATFIAKAELFVGPLARALGWLDQIPVHRGRPDRGALRAGLAVLRAGGALGVFPEGTRGAGQLETVSDGVAYLAVRSGAPVVPLAVLGTGEAMPKGARLPRWRAPVALVFGEPFTIEVHGDPRVRSTVRDAGEQIRVQLLAHLTEAARSTSRQSAGPAERSA